MPGLQNLHHQHLLLPGHVCGYQPTKCLMRKKLSLWLINNKWNNNLLVKYFVFQLACVFVWHKADLKLVTSARQCFFFSFLAYMLLVPFLSMNLRQRGLAIIMKLFDPSQFNDDTFLTYPMYYMLYFSFICFIYFHPNTGWSCCLP